MQVSWRHGAALGRYLTAASLSTMAHVLLSFDALTQMALPWTSSTKTLLLLVFQLIFKEVNSSPVSFPVPHWTQLLEDRDLSSIASPLALCPTAGTSCHLMLNKWVNTKCPPSKSSAVLTELSTDESIWRCFQAVSTNNHWRDTKVRIQKCCLGFSWASFTLKNWNCSKGGVVPILSSFELEISWNSWISSAQTLH